jgi:hypothetical protein
MTKLDWRMAHSAAQYYAKLLPAVRDDETAWEIAKWLAERGDYDQFLKILDAAQKAVNVTVEHQRRPYVRRAVA